MDAQTPAPERFELLLVDDGSRRTIAGCAPNSRAA